MDVEPNEASGTACPSRSVPLGTGDGSGDDFDDPDIALAARIAVSTIEHSSGRSELTSSTTSTEIRYLDSVYSFSKYGAGSWYSSGRYWWLARPEYSPR